MSSNEVDSRRRGRVIAVIVIAALAVAAVVVALVLWASAGAEPGSPSGSPSPSSSASASPDAPSASPSASAPSGEPDPEATPGGDDRFPELPPVAPDATTGADGVDVSLALIEQVEGEAVPGEVAGPAVRVTVQVVNGGSSALDLDRIVVNAYTGADRVPAEPLSRPGGAPFGGSLEPGAEAQAVYLFRIEPADRADATIVVDFDPGNPAAVFEGDLS